MEFGARNVGLHGGAIAAAEVARLAASVLLALDAGEPHYEGTARRHAVPPCESILRSLPCGVQRLRKSSRKRAFVKHSRYLTVFRKGR